MKEIINKYDKILNNHNSNFVTKSISLLHIIKSHPEYNKNYILTSENGSNAIFFYVKILYKFFKRNFDFIITYAKRLAHESESKKIYGQNVLIISHHVNEKFINSENDFYFGKLTRILKKNDISYFKLLINHTNFQAEFLNRFNKKKNQLILKNYLSLVNEIKIFLLQLKESVRLYRCLKSKNKSQRLFYKKSIFSLFDHQTKFSLRMFFLLKNLLEKIKPKYLIFTYEGFGWERLCIKAAKEFNQDIKCIGYQHTIISKNHHAMLRNIEGDYNPDIIWASGRNSFHLLKKSKRLKNVDIRNIGYLKKIETLNKKNSFSLSCLVLPEGIYSECVKLFSYSLQCAKQNTQINYIWRVHPVINLNILFNKLNVKIHSLPKNIKISNKKLLSSDISRTSFILYRGSKSVIEAMLGNNYPIYLDIKNDVNIDPIKSYSKNKKYVTSSKEFIYFVKNFKKDKIKNIHVEAKRIKHDIFGKLKSKQIINILKEKRKH